MERLATRRLPVTILLAALLAVAGCSSTSPAQSEGAASSEDKGPGAAGTPSTTLTACELVTPADVEAALSLDAGSVTEGDLHDLSSDSAPGATECEWASEDWGGLSVIETPTNGPNDFADALDALGDRAERLDIGDGAIWADDLERGYFLGGSVMVLVQFTFIAGETPFRDATVSLGEAAVARI